MKIDAHQHFWNYDPKRHAWINDDMHVIQRHFLPESLAPILHQNGIEGCIAIQADQTIEETQFLVALAAKNDWIKAVIGWVDLKADDIESQLSFWKKYPIIKGFRHILQAEEPDFMLSTKFLKGIACLQKFGYCYEILIYPRHLKSALSLVKLFPDMRFIIDHIAKPNIREHQMDDWKAGMQLLGQQKNVYCKISGLVTEADWKNWVPEDFSPYINTVVEAFGIDRLIYGSDWPVCLVAADYSAQLDICKMYFKDFSVLENDLFFGENAKRFYKI